MLTPVCISGLDTVRIELVIFARIKNTRFDSSGVSLEWNALIDQTINGSCHFCIASDYGFRSAVPLAFEIVEKRR